MKWKRIIVYSLTVAAMMISGRPGTILASERSVQTSLTRTGTPATYLLSTNVSNVVFGNVLLGKSSSHRVILTNTGNSAVRISRVSTLGTEFKTTSPALPVMLAGGQSAIVDIKFAPTKTGSITGTVEVYSDATNSPAKITVSGAGVQPELAVIPGSVNFGYVPVGVMNSQTVTLSNHSQNYIDVTRISASGTGYTVTAFSLPLNIAPGRSFAFTLRFAPKIVGAASGNITITSNAPNSLVNIPLRGSGEFPSLHLSMNTSSLSFGSINIGSNATKTVTLRNTGNAKFTVSGIKVSGAGFSASGYGLPFTLAVGQSASFHMEFAPASLGSAAGSVSVSSTANTTPDSILLSGSGTQTVAHSVELSWAPSDSSVVGYHIYRGAQTSGPFERLSSSLVAGTTYTDTTVQANTNYFYVATAVDAAGIESGFSNEISVAVP